MPGTELRRAVSMTVAPTCASTERDCPVASMKVIFAIEQSDSLEYRVTPLGRVNSVGERRLYRACLHRASRSAPKGHFRRSHAVSVIREPAENAQSRSTV